MGIWGYGDSDFIKRWLLRCGWDGMGWDVMGCDAM